MENEEFDSRIKITQDWWDSLRVDLGAIITESPSSIIYHYTDVNGLLGMISTGKIWATHASRLNDSSEYDHGIKVVADCVRKSMPATSRTLVDKILSEFKMVDTFVASYSTKPDLLSQWRSYSGGGVGYCLGFATEGIASLDHRTPLLEPVIYRDSQAQEVISTMLKRVDDFFQNNEFGEVEVGFLLGTVGATLANLACTIKHPAFEEEAEYRQFYQLGATELVLDVKFRNGRFGLTPYVDVPFIVDGSLPLISVTIGPCNDFELESFAVKALLEKYSYSNVEVVESRIPLRV